MWFATGQSVVGCQIWVGNLVLFIPLFLKDVTLVKDAEHRVD
jgi:hypothetical protein